MRSLVLPGPGSSRDLLADLRVALRDDGLWPGRGQTRSARACAVLGLAGFLAVLALAGIEVVTSRTTDHLPLALFVAPLVLLYLLLLARMVTAMVAWPERRAGTGVLLVTIALFAVGGTIAGSLPSQQSFPNVTEVIFVPPYAALAVFLILDVAGRLRRSAGAVLEALVIAGGASCLAAVGVITPVADSFPTLRGPDLLLLLLYPLLAVAMLLLVLADLRLNRRAWSIQTIGLLAGLTLLAVADSELLRTVVRPGGGGFGPAFALFWGGGLALIVTGGCGPRHVPEARDAGRRSALAPVLAASIAVAVLAGRPGGGHADYLALLALITVVLAGIRMGLALREAHVLAEKLRQTRIDDVTGLPNRLEVLAAAQAADQRGQPLALLLVDVAGFQQVNDTLGHLAGDRVLRLLGRRLVGALPSALLVARFGGDEFAVLLTLNDPDAALTQSARLRELIAQPVDVLGNPVSMGASVGIAVRDPHTVDGQELMRRAEIALYQAKSQQAGALLYHPDRDDFTADRLRIAADLRRGIPAGQLQVWYQPQVDADTHDLAGLEALVRWNHPRLGIQAPGAFLDVARRAGLMPMLTEAVLDGVLADLPALTAADARARVSFNVAPAELLNSGLIERMLAAIDAAAPAPGSLVLEVTEESLLADPERARVTLERISRHQVGVAIDDYGSGYSSLAYLRDLPVHELKMDRSFVSAIDTDERSRIIVASTSQMARGLGLRTVAEGVEYAETAAGLKELGVDVLQGYHFAKPMPLEHLLPWIADWTARNRSSPEPTEPPAGARLPPAPRTDSGGPARSRPGLPGRL